MYICNIKPLTSSYYIFGHILLTRVLKDSTGREWGSNTLLLLLQSCMLLLSSVVVLVLVVVLLLALLLMSAVGLHCRGYSFSHVSSPANTILIT